MTFAGILATAETAAIDGGEIEWFLVAVTLFGGLALFLHGLDGLTESLRLVAGSRMRRVLRRLTSNRLMGVATGRHLQWPDCRILKTQRLRIESDDEVPYQIDGDPGGKLPLEITAVPSRMRLIVWASLSPQYR